MTQTPLERIADLLTKEDAAAILVAASRRLVEQSEKLDKPITLREAAAIDDCASMPLIIPQWTDADGQTYGVIVKAPTFREIMLAERAATDEKGIVFEKRRICEEVRHMLVKPQLKSVDTLLDWNYDVVCAIHNFGTALAAYPAQLVAAELARIAGEPAPPPDTGAQPDILQPTTRPHGRRATTKKRPEQPTD